MRTRWTRDDRGRGWRDASTAKGHPGASKAPEAGRGRKGAPSRFQREHSPADTPISDLQGPSAQPDLRGDRRQAGVPTPCPPHRTPRGTHILHLTHSSTNMFPWSSASLSLWEERPGAAVGSPDPEASGLAPSPPPPGSPP